jgi:Trm5-related predicted tRNA methylase
LPNLGWEVQKKQASRCAVFSFERRVFSSEAYRPLFVFINASDNTFQMALRKYRVNVVNRFLAKSTFDRPYE